MLLKDSNLKPFQQEENKNKAIEIANKICNVEIYPFSSSDPKLKGIGKTILLNSDISRLGVYIILRRIYRYLNDKTEKPVIKPVIIFRKYDSAWEQLFIKILKEVEQEEKQNGRIFEHEKVLKLLEKGFFYCQTGQQGGGITDGNVISVPNFKTISKLFDDTKKKDFNTIKSLLTKVES